MFLKIEPNMVFLVHGLTNFVPTFYFDFLDKLRKIYVKQLWACIVCGWAKS
jgi:hypothetical protein